MTPRRRRAKKKMFAVALMTLADWRVVSAPCSFRVLRKREDKWDVVGPCDLRSAQAEGDDRLTRPVNIPGLGPLAGVFCHGRSGAVDRVLRPGRRRPKDSGARPWQRVTVACPAAGHRRSHRSTPTSNRQGIARPGLLQKVQRPDDTHPPSGRQACRLPQWLAWDPHIFCCRPTTDLELPASNCQLFTSFGSVLPNGGGQNRRGVPGVAHCLLFVVGVGNCPVGEGLPVSSTSS